MELQGEKIKNRFGISVSQTPHPQIVINKESFNNACFNKKSHKCYIGP